MNTPKADVLLVEDSAAEARLAREALTETRFAVRLHVASDGVEAMDFLRRKGVYLDAPRPQLVLLDLNLPRKDGREVLRDIKEDEDLRSIPVVVLTTSMAPSDITRAYELYANCYIQKPLELDGFIEIVKSIHRYWLQMAELPAKRSVPDLSAAAFSPLPPMVQPEEIPAAEPVAAEPASQGEAPVRILLVEDNLLDARLVEELLAEANAGFVIEHARRLSEAAERLASGGIDVVMSDLSLPDSQGMETFEKLHAAAPNVPVIVLSGLDDETLAVETVRRGAQDYLVKGRADTHLLVRSIRYALKRIASERELAEERNLLRSVINNLLDAIYVKDMRGVYRLDNLAHMRTIGAERPEDVVGKTVFDFFPYDAAVHFQADDQCVIRTGKAIVNRQEAFSQPDGSKRWLSTTKVPLRSNEGQIIGIVGIGRDITERKRAEEQLAIYNEELREKNMQLEDDLDMASEVQQAFLPQQFPSFPKDAAPGESALGFAARYLPTGAVGGDFFHVLPLSNTEAGVFICDVMGHGVRAALVTAIQRALVEELSGLGRQPGEFLTHINEALLSILRRTRTPMFASAFYLYLNAETGEMRYSNAGHPKPLQLRRSEKRVEVLAANGTRPGSALGVFEHATYRTFQGEAKPGDLILMFTDGIFEVEGPAGDYFDQQRLIAAVERRLLEPSEELIEGLLTETRDYSVKHQFGDDVCLVGVDVKRLLAGEAGELGGQKAVGFGPIP